MHFQNTRKPLVPCREGVMVHPFDLGLAKQIDTQGVPEKEA